MAASAQATPYENRTLDRLTQFLRDELRPYPGRAATVGRITVAVVLTLILVTTFRIPSAGITLYNVFLITREGPRAAIRTALFSIGAVTLGLAVSLFGVALFIDYPLAHFLFFTACFFVLFFLTRTVTQSNSIATLGLAVYTAAVQWDRPYPAEQHLEGTLWLWVSMSLGFAVAALVEFAAVRENPLDFTLSGIGERLDAVAVLSHALAEGDEPKIDSASARVTRLALVGTGRLRRHLIHISETGGIDPLYTSELLTVLMLAGRMVDVSANLHAFPGPANPDDDGRLLRLAAQCEEIRRSITARLQPEPIVVNPALNPPSATRCSPNWKRRPPCSPRPTHLPKLLRRFPKSGLIVDSSSQTLSLIPNTSASP